MRHTFPRDFYIPKDAKPLDCPDTDAVVYVYENAKRVGSPYGAVAFHGKANKPDWHYTFKTEERRTAYIAEYLAGRKASPKKSACVTPSRIASTAACSDFHLPSSPRLSICKRRI